jgi:hypothetical protein
MLSRLKGIGPETSAVLWSECLFRQFDNRSQVGHLQSHRPGSVYIAKDNHGAGDVSSDVADRRSGIFNGRFPPVVPNKHTVPRQV